MPPFDEIPGKGFEPRDGIQNEVSEKARFASEVLRVNETGEPEVLRVTMEGFDPKDVADIQPEAWRFTESQAEAASMTLRDVMTEQTGFAWAEGLNTAPGMLDAVELLEKECYVQVSRFSEANIAACLRADGSVMAYVPDQLWRQVTAQPDDSGYEVPGLHTVQVVAADREGVVVSDHSMEGGQWISLNKDAVAMISQNGWILEVYK